MIKDYTTGPLFRRLLVFAWPFVISNLLQAAYNLADMVIVGRMIGTAGLSAVSIGTDLVHLYMLFGMGLCEAGQILVSQYVGLRDREGISNIIGVLITAVGLLSVAVTVAGLLLLDTWMTLLSVPAEALADCRAYTLCCTAGTVFQYGYTMVAAVLRGLGDSKRPMLIVTISSVLNILLDWVFIRLGMGAFGAALATVLAQAVSFAVICVYLLRRKDSLGFDLGRRYLWPDKKYTALLVKLGIPMMLQGCAISISTLYISACVNAYGVAVSAISGVGQKLTSIINIITQSMRQAAAVVIGQNFAARKFTRVKQTVWIALSINLVFAAIFSAELWLWPRETFALFNKSEDMLALCGGYVPFVILTIFGCATRSPSNALCNGMGFPRMNFILGILDGVVMRIGLSWLLGRVLGYELTGYWLGSALAGFAFFVVMFPYFLSGRWRRRAPPVLR